MSTDRTTPHLNNLWMRDAVKLLLAALIVLTSDAWVSAGEPSAHWHHAGAMPPGAIGRQRLLRGAPLAGTCQPVEIRAPQGVRIAPAAGGSYLEGSPNQLLVGLTIGPVYRFRVSEIPENPGLEVFPTLELVDRLYPPCGQELRFPVPVELTPDELILAAEGRFITRVIYVEDPQLAPAIARSGEEQPWIEARPGEDPLVMADHLGRPIAILRMGGRVPEGTAIDSEFNYGSPPMMVYDHQLVGDPRVRHDYSVEQAIPNQEIIGSEISDDELVAPQEMLPLLSPRQ